MKFVVYRDPFYSITELLENTQQLSGLEEGYVVEFNDGQFFKFKSNRYIELSCMTLGLSFQKIVSTLENHTFDNFVVSLPEEFTQQAEDYKQQALSIYQDTFDEAQRLIRISDEIRISMEKIDTNIVSKTEEKEFDNNIKLTTSKLATQLGLKTTDLLAQLETKGFLVKKGEAQHLSDQALKQGAEFKKGQYGYYFLWSEMIIQQLDT